MTLNVGIGDSLNSVRIDRRDRALEVIAHPHPPTEDSVNARPFRQFFTDTGSSSGSNDMKVASSGEFWIEASPDLDTFVKTISIVIADGSASLSQFGNISALSNGCIFQWETQDLGTVILHDGLKTNWDFIRLSGGNPPFGSTTNAFIANNVFGNSEAYIPMVDLQYLCGLQYGVRLRRGSKDKIKFIIQDQTDQVDQFDAIGYGLQL